MPGTFSPPPRVNDPNMHHGMYVTHVPWCLSGSLISGFLRSRWQGKRSRHSQHMRNPKFYVSGKRPIAIVNFVAVIVKILTKFLPTLWPCKSVSIIVMQNYTHSWWILHTQRYNITRYTHSTIRQGWNVDKILNTQKTCHVVSIVIRPPLQKNY